MIWLIIELIIVINFAELVAFFVFYYEVVFFREQTWLMTFHGSWKYQAAPNWTFCYRLQKKLEFYLSTSVQAGGKFEIYIFFWFFSKTVIFGNRNMLYDSYSFAKLWKNEKKWEKGNFEMNFSQWTCIHM